VYRSSEDITPRSSLLRTHASIPCGSPLLRLLASFVEFSQVATSPCCYRDSPDVIPANLSPDAWSPTPTVPPSALACFLLGVIGLPKTLFRSASRWYPRTRFFRGLVLVRRAAEAFTSGLIVLRCLRTRRICYLPEYRQSPRHFKPIVPISSNGLTCLLPTKGYGTVSTGWTFSSDHGRRSR
jgi:hypothetical protein